MCQGCVSIEEQMKKATNRKVIEPRQMLKIWVLVRRLCSCKESDAMLKALIIKHNIRKAPSDDDFIDEVTEADDVKSKNKRNEALKSILDRVLG